MKKLMEKLMVLTLMMSILLSFSACDLFGTDDDTSLSGIDSETQEKIKEQDEMTDEEAAEALDNGIYFEEEQEGTKLHFRKSAKEEYIGSWEATSSDAIFRYGVLEIKILPGGKWNGVVVDEKVNGKWSFENNQVKLSSEYFNATLQYTNTGALVMQEDRGEEGNEDILTTVLTKKE